MPRRSIASFVLAAAVVLPSCAPAPDTMAAAPPGSPHADGGAPCTGANGCVQTAVCVPGRSAAQFQRQTPPPSSMSPGDRARVSVTFANCSGHDWNAADGWGLEPSASASDPGWGVTHARLPDGVVPAGSEVSIAFEVTAPATQGSVAFSWSITQPSGLPLQEPSREVDIDVRAPADCSVAGPPVRSRFDAPPRFVPTGHPAHATLVLANCSTTVWTHADYLLEALDGTAAAAFGASRVALPVDVASGDRASIDLDLTVPATQGAYELAWRLVRDTGTDPTPLDTPTPHLALIALEAADCPAEGPVSRFVRQMPPDVMPPDSTLGVHATFANCSDATWDATYALVPGPGAPDGHWGVDRAPLPLDVGPGFAIDIPFTVRAPGTPGMYSYRWAVANGSTALDEPSPPLDVTVRCVPMCDGRNCGADGCGGSCGSCGGTETCDTGVCRQSHVSCGALQWWNTYKTSVTHPGWWDTDLGVHASTPVQLRHASRLDAHGVYGWGFVPTFTDLVTGAQFRFLHLRPAFQYATDNGRVYPAGFIVGISGGDTRDTGFPTWSTGAHLCVQTPGNYDADFPRGTDACM